MSAERAAPALSLIAAIARNGAIGLRGALPWRLPEDLKHFRRITLGHPVIMGRKTWESIGRPLPGRDNIVLTRASRFTAAGCTVTHSLDAALQAASGAGEAFVIGGADVYAAAMPLARRLYLTEIERDFEGDAFFPAFERREWIEVSRERHRMDGAGGFGYDFALYRRSDSDVRTTFSRARPA